MDDDFYLVKTLFYVTSGLADMTSLKFSIADISLILRRIESQFGQRDLDSLCDFEVTWNIVWYWRSHWCLESIARSMHILSLSFDLSILDRITLNFKVWSLKKELPVAKILRHQYFKIEISPLLTVGLSSNLLKQNQIDDLHLNFNMVWDIINLVFNKMGETFQSNTLDWSSLVIIILLSSACHRITLSIFIRSLPNLACN